MPLRLLQVILPNDQHQDLCSLLDEIKCEQHWIIKLDNDMSMTCVLLQKEAVEEVSDTVKEHYKYLDGFRTILYDIQTTFPPLPEPEKEALEEAQPKEAKPSWRPRFGRVSRDELVEDIKDSAKITPVFIVMVVLATIVACVGLIKDSPAIIIGAMVIAPLLGPNTALALGTMLGNTSMIRSAIKSNVLGLGIAISIALFVGYFGVSDEPTKEITTRTVVDIGDIALALASGAAGALAFTTGASSTLVGVMVAVALLPPTAACGMLLGAGEPTQAAGAAVLAATNIVCINLASASVLLVQGVSPTTWYEKDKAKKATITALVTWTIALATLAALILYFW